MLLPELYKLRHEHKDLQDKRVLVMAIKGCQGYYRRYAFNKQMRQMETKTLALEVEFKKLQD